MSIKTRSANGSPYQPKTTPTPLSNSVKSQNSKSSPYDASGIAQVKTKK